MEETDFSTIEQQKENILPLERGRSASLLAQVFAEPTKSKTTRLQTQEEFEILISQASNEDDDPLDPFVRYVAWIQSHYPSGKSQVMRVVEKAVRRFKGDSRYKNDPRFLKLWLMVAHQAKVPLEVFKYLSVNQIGSELALYYEDYAHLLEKSNR